MMQHRLQQYTAEVMKFRRALNLTSINDPDAFHARFIAPSLALSRWMPESGRMLDIGSGMGIPGIPLQIAHPEITAVLVERRKKRAEFLRHVARTLSLNSEVYDADINALPRLHIDICVARAVSDDSTLLQMCTPHCNPNAVALLPVPRQSRPASVAHWNLIDESTVQIGDSSETLQLIRQYRFKGSREEVSRET